MNNVNYNPEKLAYYSEENAGERYENEKRRKLTDMAIRNQREPWERETPDLEGVVDISEGEE